MRIYRLSDAPPVSLAADELADYLVGLTGEKADVEHRAYDPDVEALWVGPGETLPVDLPAVADPAWDDAIAIETDGSTGAIAGNTPRATLLAAYRYLRELGCRWVRPGPEGEVVPEREHLPPISVTETPDDRYRGISVGGGDDEEGLRELIEWAPRVGYNAAMIEFFEGELFRKARDRRRGHPATPDEPLSDERAMELHDVAVEAIEERGLSYHAVGHNWTGTVLGMVDRPREADDDAVPPDRREYLAEVDGERSLFGRGPLDTELCYSNPAVRERFADAVADYAENHPEIDVLHAWLSDGHNNHCECADCRGTRPSDYYVAILNAIGARLTGRGLDTKVAFLAYTDLLWPPVEEEIENEERFALMFAPITRSYATDWSTAAPDKIPPSERNDCDFPADLSENVAFLEAWREAFGGDGFVFDYHFWRAQYRDPGGVRIADVAAADARALDEIGLDGSVSCNVRRAFFPHGLGMWATARALWNPAFGELAEEYAEAAYGAGADDALAYLRELSGAVEVEWLRSAARGTGAAEGFASVRETIAAFALTIEEHRGTASGTRARSWDLLAEHADIWDRLAAAFEAWARGDDAAARERWADVGDLLCERSDDLAPVLELHLFENTHEGRFDGE